MELFMLQGVGPALEPRTDYLAVGRSVTPISFAVGGPSAAGRRCGLCACGHKFFRRRVFTGSSAAGACSGSKRCGGGRQTILLADATATATTAASSPPCAFASWGLGTVLGVVAAACRRRRRRPRPSTCGPPADCPPPSMLRTRRSLKSNVR